MPLTQKGQQIKANMVRKYGEKKGTEVFYASRNAGTISGVDRVPPGSGRNDRAAPGVAIRVGGRPTNYADACDFVPGSTSPRLRR